MVCSEYSNGFSISLRSDFNHAQYVEHEKSKRGQIRGFSAKSCARLRRLLMRLNLEGKEAWALTLTVPGHLNADEWRLLVERFRTRLLRLKVGLVWRVELQRRGVPHLHCVLVCDTINQVMEVWHAWVSSSNCVYEGCIQSGQGFICVPWSCHRGFLAYSFSGRKVSGPGWYAYVASHTAKHKSSQLGWIGRQWGIINQKCLSFVGDSNESTVDDGFLIFLCRCIRKRWKFSKVHIMKKGTYDFFCSPAFVKKAKLWYYRDSPF